MKTEQKDVTKTFAGLLSKIDQTTLPSAISVKMHFSYRQERVCEGSFIKQVDKELDGVTIKIECDHHKERFFQHKTLCYLIDNLLSSATDLSEDVGSGLVNWVYSQMPHYEDHGVVTIGGVTIYSTTFIFSFERVWQQRCVGSAWRSIN